MSRAPEMLVMVEPGTLVLEEGPPQWVHDVGEMVEIRSAAATLTVAVRVLDAATQQPLPAAVHVRGRTVPANAPFQHRFVCEFNERTGHWAGDLIWVESPGYENRDVPYNIAVYPRSEHTTIEQPTLP